MMSVFTKCFVYFFGAQNFEINILSGLLWGGAKRAKTSITSV